MPVSLAIPVVALASTIGTPLLNVGVTATSALERPPLFSSASPVPTLTILASVLPSSSSRPSVSLDYIYTSCDIDLMWSIGYKPKQRTLTGFVSFFDENLIRSIRVQNETNSTKVFLRRSLVILEENGQRHQEALSKVASLEAKISMWRATARTVSRMERPKVANAIVAFAKVIKSNRQLSSKVGDVLAKLLRTRLDVDNMFGRCKDLLKEKFDLVSKVESTAVEKEELAKVFANLKAQLKESESKLEESKLRALKEREVSKELEEEELVFKKEAMEQHEKGFYKVVR